MTVEYVTLQSNIAARLVDDIEAHEQEEWVRIGGVIELQGPADHTVFGQAMQRVSRDPFFETPENSRFAIQ